MNVWIFDVDGVLSNLEARKVTHPDIFPLLAKLLEKGDFVTYNTGRNGRWVEEKILQPLSSLVSDQILFSHSFIAGEKGGTYQQYHQPEQIAPHLSVDPALKEKVFKLVTDEFHDSIFIDETKQTMISLEMKENLNEEYFHSRQQQLMAAIQKILAEFGLEHEYVIDNALIAVDVQHRKAGKHIGMQHILTWIATQTRSVDQYYCLGDSPSDLSMGSVLRHHQLPFTFIYVGQRTLPSPLLFTPVIPDQPHDKGTVGYLHKILAQ